MASPLASPWYDGGLPLDLLLLVLVELHCLANRVSFGAVCRRWREAEKHARRQAEDAQQALALPAPPRQIPWLLLPSPNNAPSIVSFLSGARRRIHSLPDDIGRGRLCGSHPGGWLGVSVSPFGAKLLANLFSGVRIDLPRMLRTARFSTVSPVFIHAVMLSAAPTDAGCVAGAIVAGASNVAFCRPGADQHWIPSYPEVAHLHDMVYYEGKVIRGFHVLTKNLDVGAFAVGGATPFSTGARMFCMPECHDIMLRVLPEETMRTAYLVVSREKLVMVVRYYKVEEDGLRRTMKFRVYEMLVKPRPKARHHAAYWKEMRCLGGRVLFVGRGCSRAFEASEIKGFKGGSIYFLDDTEFDLSVEIVEEPQYFSTDMGMYTLSPSDDEIIRPGYVPTASSDMPSSSIYGEKTCLVGFNHKEYRELEENISGDECAANAKHSRGKIVGTWSGFPTEPLSEFSPAIWFST
ncbi:hypothetical protein ACP4OV_013317 [Aristida adscensionis]